MQESPGEIIEVNIDSIYLRSPESSAYHPSDGTAKWFRDELGQTWVKFRLRLFSGETQTIVVPSDRVSEVNYLPR